METVALFAHRALGGATLITSVPRYESTPGFKVGRYGYTIATFDNGGMGQFAYGAFKTGCATAKDKLISIYHEDDGRYDVGDVAQLDIAPEHQNVFDIDGNEYRFVAAAGKNSGTVIALVANPSITYDYNPRIMFESAAKAGIARSQQRLAEARR